MIAEKDGSSHKAVTREEKTKSATLDQEPWMGTGCPGRGQVPEVNEVEG